PADHSRALRYQRYDLLRPGVGAQGGVEIELDDLRAAGRDLDGLLACLHARRLDLADVVTRLDVLDVDRHRSHVRTAEVRARTGCIGEHAHHTDAAVHRRLPIGAHRRGLVRLALARLLPRPARGLAAPGRVPACE